MTLHDEQERDMPFSARIFGDREEWPEKFT
jgi:hypothetical protein